MTCLWRACDVFVMCLWSVCARVCDMSDVSVRCSCLWHVWRVCDVSCECGVFVTCDSSWSQRSCTMRRRQTSACMWSALVAGTASPPTSAFSSHRASSMVTGLTRCSEILIPSQKHWESPTVNCTMGGSAYQMWLTSWMKSCGAKLKIIISMLFFAWKMHKMYRSLFS